MVHQNQRVGSLPQNKVTLDSRLLDSENTMGPASNKSWIQQPELRKEEVVESRFIWQGIQDNFMENPVFPEANACDGNGCYTPLGRDFPVKEVIWIQRPLSSRFFHSPLVVFIGMRCNRHHESRE